MKSTKSNSHLSHILSWLKPARLLATAVLWLAVASHSPAALVDVNFANNTVAGYPLAISGAAAIGSPGDQWNTISKGSGQSVSGTNYALINTAGAASGVSLNISTGSFDGGDNTAYGYQTLFKSSLFLDGSSTYGPPGPSTITLTGFAPGQPVNLLLYGDNGSQFTFSGQTLIPAGGDHTTFAAAEYVEFNGLVANGAGTITGSWHTNTTYAHFYGFQINTNATASPLGISTQPASRSVYAGGSAAFTVQAGGGSGIYTYQWYQNNTNLVGKTNASLTLSNVSTNLNGFAYQVVVNDSRTSVTSSNATLSVLSGVKFIDVNFANNTVSGYPLLVSGAAVVGSVGDQWNTITGSSGSSVAGTHALLDTTGAGSGVNLTMGVGAFDGGDYTLYGYQNLFKSSVFLDGSGAYGPQGPSSIALSGFAPGQPITLFLYCNNGSAITFSNQTLIPPASQDFTTFNATTYVAYTNLVADGTGTITGAWQTNTTYANVYGMQVMINTLFTPFFVHTQPASQTVFSGSAATFSVQAGGGSGNYTYQWYQNNSSLAGKTNASLTLSNVSFLLNGNTYHAVVSDGSTSITSSNAVLTVKNGKLIDVNFEFNATAPYPLPISGPAVLGSAGDVWNTITSSNFNSVSCLCLGGSTPPTIFSLVNTTGNNSGVGLSVSVGTFYGADLSAYGYETLFKGNIFLDQGGAFGPSGPSIITLSGFSPGQTIDLLLYANSSSYFAVPPTNPTITFTTANDFTSFNPSTYVSYTGLTADANGQVTAKWDNLGAYAFLYGMQIVQYSLPYLTANLEGGQTVVRWPVSATGFNLYSTPVLGSGASWTQVISPAPIVDAANTNLLKVTLTPSGKMFFRLQK